MDNPLLADPINAQHFLCALDPSGLFSFQTFDDDKHRKSKALVRILHGTFDKHAATLSALNQQGAGVFVMVNQGDLKGRKEANVQKVRALFVDLDGAPLEPVLECGVPPQIIVDSSPGRWHAYWNVSDCALENFKPLQQKLAAKFGADPSASDLPRVMRLPGFYHRKGEPTLTKVQSINSGAPYTVAQIARALALTPATQLPSVLALTSTAQSANADAIGGIRIPPDPEEPCPEGQRNNRLASLAGRWIVEGKTFDALTAAASDWNQLHCQPPLDDTEVHTVCTSIWQKHAREHSRPTNGFAAVSVDPSGWEEPILFTEYTTPEIPASLLPGEFGAFAAALATATETPEAMSVFAVLGTLSAALAKRFVVNPNPTWNEPVNIYTLVALPPANNKSLVLSRCTAPLRDWETAQARLLDHELKKQRSERRNLEKLVEFKRTKAARNNIPAEQEHLFREINELEAKLPQPKSLPQLFANDATPEALAQSVHDQGGRFAVISDEGGIVETLAGLYSGGAANVDVILKGIDGGDVRVRRKERNYDLKPFLTFMLIVQPRIIQTMGERQAFRGNGMLERFMYVLPASMLGYRKLDTAAVPGEVQAAYSQAVRRLLDLQPIFDERGEEQPRSLTLAPDAAVRFKQLRDYVEVELRPDGKLHGCLGWGGKLAGYALRLAGLLHVAEHEERIKVISADTMDRAVYLALLLIDHARAAFNLMGVDQAIEDAKAVIVWIKTRGALVFRKTECHKALHGRFTTAARLNAALHVLAERNIVSRPESMITTTGKRSTTTFRVNPMLLGTAT